MFLLTFENKRNNFVEKLNNFNRFVIEYVEGLLQLFLSQLRW